MKYNFELTGVKEHLITNFSLKNVPETCIVSGSGLKNIISSIKEPVIIPVNLLPGYPALETVAGHGAELVFGRINNTQVMVFTGRTHMYQGLRAVDVAYPSRLAAAMGCKNIIVTNAAGAVNKKFLPGDVMVLNGHLNFLGDNPLVGWNGPKNGNPFVALDNAYNSAMSLEMLRTLKNNNVRVWEGVYAAFLGPSYETREEVYMLRVLGADAVGMSTVPEIIAARALGLDCIALSVIANSASETELNHDEVVAIVSNTGEKIATTLTDFLK